MSFGKMNCFITIAKTEYILDDEGFKTEEQANLANIRAYRERRHGSEKWTSLAMFSDATELFRFRVIPNIKVTTDMVIICENKCLEILSVEDVKGKRMYVEVLCKEVQASG